MRVLFLLTVVFSFSIKAQQHFYIQQLDKKVDVNKFGKNFKVRKVAQVTESPGFIPTLEFRDRVFQDSGLDKFADEAFGEDEMLKDILFIDLQKKSLEQVMEKYTESSKYKKEFEKAHKILRNQK